MPSITAMQGLQLDDEDAVQAWLMAHRARHQSMAYAASLLGVTVGPYVLAGYPDDTWFANHISAHQVLEQFYNPDSTVSLSALQNYSWDDQDSFDTWMQMHTLLHSKLDQSSILNGAGGNTPVTTYYLTNDAATQNITDDAGANQLTSQ